MQMNLGKSLLDAAQHLLVPVNFQIGMQAALHQHACPAKFYRLANLVVDGFKIEDVPLFSFGSLQWTIKRAERAVFGAEVRVINVAIDDVGDHALGMQFAPDGVGLHADANQIIGTKQIDSLCFGKGHSATKLILPNGTPASNSCGFRARSGGGLVWLSAHPQVFNQRQYSAQDCQSD